jgi:hypothetical protein
MLRAEAVDPRHHEHVVLAEEVEHGAQLFAAGGRGAAPLLGADHVATGGAQGRLLN